MALAMSLPFTVGFPVNQSVQICENRSGGDDMYFCCFLGVAFRNNVGSFFDSLY
jgi:hypothetical protein